MKQILPSPHPAMAHRGRIAGFAVINSKLNLRGDRAEGDSNTNADEVMGTGTLEARVKTTVSARIQERLAEVLVDQGDKVKAGQLLARLDDAEIKQQVAIAEATLRRRDTRRSV
jgi:multidrug efflux pump subunit AcrA (membrane-fusion protein)